MTSYIDKSWSRFESLIENNQLLLSAVSTEESLRIILNTALRLFSAEACSVAVVDEDSHQLAFAFLAGDAVVEEFRIDLGQGIAGYVARTGE